MVRVCQVIRGTLSLLVLAAGFYTLLHAVLQIENTDSVVSSTSWLLDNPNIADEPISDDVMPDYFNLSAPLIPQYDRYFNETKLIMENRMQKMKGQKAKHFSQKQKVNRVFFFSELKMAWCPVFKAGSTNWKQFFCKIYKPNVYNNYLNATQEPYCPINELASHRSKNHTTDSIWMADMQGSLRFLTVRHPYERLASVYNNKFKNCDSTMFSAPRDHMVQILKAYRKVSLRESQKAPLIEAARTECLKPAINRSIDKNNPYMNPMGVTFREFIEYLVKKEEYIPHIVEEKKKEETIRRKKKKDNTSFMWEVKKTPTMPDDFHWMSASRACHIYNQDYDIVEKFETLERDHYYILQTLGEEVRYPDIAGARGNPSGNPMATARDKIIEHFSELNEELLWGLQNIYNDDFDAFGYIPYFRVKQYNGNIERVNPHFKIFFQILVFNFLF